MADVGFDGQQILPAVVFSDADLVDIKRFAGYPAQGTGVIEFAYSWLFTYYTMLIVRLQNLTPSEGAVVQQFLTQLRTLEAAIPATGAGLDTAVAAVFTRNPKELKERKALYRDWRMEFCRFLGVPFGDSAQPGGNRSSGGVSFII